MPNRSKNLQIAVRGTADILRAVLEAARGVVARAEDLELNNGEAEELGIDQLRAALLALDLKLDSMRD